MKLNGVDIETGSLRTLAVQRALAHGAPIRTLGCSSCGTSLISGTSGWIEPSTTHYCTACGEVTKTRRKAFLNPLADH